MTGILPVKKYGLHSALNMFIEYSMTDQGDFEEYTGFTQEEVQELCERYGMDFEGLKEDIVQMLGGESVKVNTLGFQNDMRNFKTKDDILTLLIHIGYLGYDAEKKEAFIPNKEIVMEFENAMSTGGWAEVMVELKYDKSAETAIQQIKDKQYTQALEGYGGEIVLVGINYDKEAKTHSCVIERVEKERL